MSVSEFGSAMFIPSAGIASATSSAGRDEQRHDRPAQDAVDDAGQKRDRCRRQVRQEGNAAAVDARPEQLEHRRQHGHRPATAQATTAIVPAAIPVKMAEPTMNWPAIAIATVAPAITTVRPEVRAVRSSASCEGTPRRRSSRERIDVEERVVDADRHADQQHDRLDAVVERERVG